MTVSKISLNNLDVRNVPEAELDPGILNVSYRES